MEYDYKIVGTEIVPEFTKLFNQNKKKKINPKYFLHKFSSPTDLDYVGSVAYGQDGRIVSHICTIPIKLKYNDEIINAGFAADNLTDINHRRKGLFRETTQRMIDHIQVEGKIKLLFSLPNPPNFIGFVNQLGYSHVDSFNTFLLATKCLFPLIKFFNKFNLILLRHLYMKFVTFLFYKNKMSFMNNSVIDDGQNGFIHDESFNKYKSYDNKYLVRFGENVIWFKLEDGIVVGDFSFKKSDDFLKRLNQFCYYFGIHKVMFRVTSDTKQFKFLKSILEPISSSPICMRNVSKSEIDITTIKLVFADSNTF